MTVNVIGNAASITLPIPVGSVTGAAPTTSPALGGTPTGPTAAALTDDTQLATTAYADNAVAVLAGGVYPARSNGLLCNGVVIYNATLSSGNHISSTSYTFTSADIGKIVALDGGISGGNGTGIFTISSVSVGAAVLNANPYNGLSGRMYFGTDDTTALQALVTAVVAAGGGTIQFPDNSITMINGAQQSGTVSGNAYSGQILFPARTEGLTVPEMTVQLAGTTPSPMVFYGVQAGANMPPNASAPVIYSTANTAGGNFIDAIPVATGLGPFTVLQLDLRNLTILQSRNTLSGSVRAFYLWSFKAEGVTFGPDVSNGALSVNQPAGSGVGVIAPGVDNAAYVVMRDCQVYGYPVGLVHYEHMVADNVVIYACPVAVQPGSGGSGPGAGHVAEYRKLQYACCTVGIQPGAKVYITGTMAIESYTVYTNSPWWLLTDDISDPNNYLHGDLKYHRTDQNVLTNPASNVIVSGAANLKLINIGTAPGPFTPTLPSSGVASLVENSSAVQVARDCQLIITGGTVTAIAVDGTATGLTSGSVFVPAGHTFTITYSAAPTVVAIAL